MCEVCGKNKVEYTCPFREDDNNWVVYKVCSACVPDEMIDYVMPLREDKKED